MMYIRSYLFALVLLILYFLVLFIFSIVREVAPLLASFVGDGFNPSLALFHLTSV